MRNAAVFLALALSLAGCGRVKVTDDPGKQTIPYARLRKLSLHLRGLLPEPVEYDELKAAFLAKKAEPFFTGKARQYLATPQHVGKMIDRLDELFRVRQAVGLPETRWLLAAAGKPAPLTQPTPGFETFNAMDFLFERVARENLPWDTLVTAREYAVLVPPALAVFNGFSDLGFFNAVAPELPASSDGILQPEAKKLVAPAPGIRAVKFEAGDDRFGGVVTTARFFNRYNATNLNRNRGRAAALFRILLCDDMRAVIQPSANEEAELLEKAFPKLLQPAPTPPPPPVPPSAMHPPILRPDQHGKDPSCIACHYKLDPLGRAFLTHGAVMSPDPSPGAIVYKREDGSTVNVEGRALGAVLAAVVRQPEYARCQARHFWRWFVEAEPPRAERLDQVVQAFEAAGRRPNDFIAWLVAQPEFRREAIDPTAPTLRSVYGLLQRCQSCHDGRPDLAVAIPPFTKFPIDGKKHRVWIAKIALATDLAHDGLKKTMPPPNSPWQLSPDDTAKVKAWVAAGARGDDGQPTIPADLAATLTGGTR